MADELVELAREVKESSGLEVLVRTQERGVIRI